jgi:translation initiation factor IF-2
MDDTFVFNDEACALSLSLDINRGSMTVGQLSEILDEKPAAVIKFLMTDLGVMAAISQTLDHLTCVTVAQGFNRVVAGEGEEDEEEDDSYDEDDEETALESGFALDEDYPEDLVPRPPVVTIMGHVDHGKTSLLDAIRNTRVQAGEAGGITQHIGAYQVEHEGNLITFIDTPGHAAFTDMRSRGANMTDIVILVVAADDGVKQQTVDSIACARTAGVPIVVAINKCDLDTASPERVKTDLTSYGILTEDLGGDVLVSEISAKQGTGLSDLLSKVMLQSEIQELTANPNRAAQGALVEAKVEKGLGTVATTLIQKGTIKVCAMYLCSF